MRLAQEHNTVTLVRFEPTAPQSRIKHSTTEPLCSLFFSTMTFNKTKSLFITGFIYNTVLFYGPQTEHYKCRAFPDPLLTLNAAIATKVVCFSCLLKCLRSLYGKQCVPRSDCSYRSSLFWVHPVCFYT